MGEQDLAAGPSGPWAGRAPARSRGVGMDMVRSLGLVALALLVWMYFAHPRTPDPVKPVDWYPIATQAAAGTPYLLVAPPASFGWTATSARVESQPDGTQAWQLGFYTPAQDYAAVQQRGVFPDQATGSVQDWIDAQTRDGRDEGSVTIGGRTWTRMVGDPTPDEKRSLVAVEDGTVTIVTGSAQWDELEALAGSLTPVAAG